MQDYLNDKEFLKEVVTSAINKQVYIKEERVDKYF